MSWDRLGHLFHRALALYGAARCLIALGRPSDAVPRALAATAVFDSLEAGWLAAEAATFVAEASRPDSG